MQESKSEKRSWLGQSYIGKHWRGEHSLPVSYFVNNLLVYVVGALVVFLISEMIPRDYSPWPVFFASVGIWGFLIALDVWQFVGVWRSADKHPSRGGRVFWAGAAKVMIVLGVLQSVAIISENGWPVVRETFRIAIGDPDIGPFTLKLAHGGTVIKFEGGIRFGAAEKLGELLDAAPEVHTIHLISHGGRIGAAENLRDQIWDRGLNTFVSAECLSACTVAYLGGHERLFHPEARIGFHASSFPGILENDMRNENQRIANDATSVGVERRFAEKAYLFASDSMWYPSAEELVEARFVTRITRFQSRASLEDLLLTGQSSTLYKAIKKYVPEEFDSMIASILDLVNSSASDDQIFEKSANITAELRQKYALYAYYAPDELIRSVIELLIENIRLFAMDWKNCNKFLIYGGMGFPSDMLDEHYSNIEKTAVATFRALFEGVEAGGSPKVATDDDWMVFGDYWLASGATDRDFNSVSGINIDDPNLCPATISLLRAMLAAEGSATERVRASYLADVASN